MTVNHVLIDADDSVLIVIDVQPTFLEKLSLEEQQPLISRVCWLIGVARWLHLPLIVTAEDTAHLAGSAPQIEAALPAHTPTYNKLVFGLTDEPHIIAAVEQTGRKTMVLVGLETDVCITHSALGLLDHGYRVVVVADATSAPGTAHAHGIERMRAAGVIITSVKGVYYEWMRTVARAEQFRAECGDALGVPLGVVL